MDSFKTPNRLPGPGKGAREGGGLLSAQAKDSRHVSRGHRCPCGPCPGTPRSGEPSSPRSGDQAQVWGGAGGRLGGRGRGREPGSGEPAVGEQNALATGGLKKFKAATSRPSKQEPSRSRAQPAQARSPCPAPSWRFLWRTARRPSQGGVGVVLGAAGVRPLVCPVCARWDLQFQRSGEGMEVTPSSSPSQKGPAGEAAPPGGQAAAPGRPAPIRASGQAGRPGRSPALREASAAEQPATEHRASALTLSSQCPSYIVFCS